MNIIKLIRGLFRKKVPDPELAFGATKNVPQVSGAVGLAVMVIPPMDAYQSDKE